MSAPRAQRAFTLIELLLASVVLSTLVALAVATYSSYSAKVKVGIAVSDITSMEVKIQQYLSANGCLPTTLAEAGVGSVLDPWGHPYQYLDFTGLKGLGAVRKDRSLVPLNSDYDLYSDGPDAASLPPITAPVSQDDIIRANDGGYVGQASDY